MKNSFLIYKDWLPLIKSLPDKKRLQFYDLLFDYSGLDYNPKVEDSHLKGVLEFVLEKIKANDAKYTEIVEKRSIAGKKGGRPRKQKEAKKPNAFSEKQTKAKKADTDTDTVTVPDTELTLKQKMKSIWMKEFPDYDFKQNDWADIAAIRNNIIDDLKNKQGDKYFNIAEAAVEAEFARIVQNFPEWYRQNALFLSSMADKNKFKMILNKIQPPQETIVAHDPRNRRI